MKNPSIFCIAPIVLIFHTFRAFAHENHNVFEYIKPAAVNMSWKMDFPKPEINYVESPYGVTDNYTLSVLNTANITQELEKEHIQEHLQVPMNTNQMTETELQFHYFQMHDTDFNKMLDGLEIMNSIIHQHGVAHARNGTDAKIFTDKKLIHMVDSILSRDDVNGDGFVDFREFMLAQRRSPK